jgi:hypothetical protein
VECLRDISLKDAVSEESISRIRVDRPAVTSYILKIPVNPTVAKIVGVGAVQENRSSANPDSSSNVSSAVEGIDVCYVTDDRAMDHFQDAILDNGVNAPSVKSTCIASN